ncbi:MAG: hypothetical protein U9N84_00095 [Actinomycetota bacterium]|nr:hypothetical protein [Actinomycetota bacterium]
MTRQTANPPSSELWRLRGASLRFGLITAVAFLAGSVLALMIDLVTAAGWDAPTLQAWTLVPQILAVSGLLFLGFRCASASFVVLAVLLALVVVEEAFHVLNPIAAKISDAATAGSNWTGFRLTVLIYALIYGLVALIGLVMIFISHQRGSVAERPVVRNLALMLAVGGLIGGPAGAVLSSGRVGRWPYVEELGEAVVFAAIAGYVAGLVVRSRSPRDASQHGGCDCASDLPKRP